MNETNETKKTDCCEKTPASNCCDLMLAFWVLRLWLGVRALLAGIEKFGAYQSVAMPVIDPATGQPDASGVMVNVNVKHYAFANYSGVPAALKDKFTHEPLLPKPEPEDPDPPKGEDDPPMPVALAPFVAPVGVMPPVWPTVCPNKPTGGTLASP